MPVAFDGTNTRVGCQLDVPVQSVRATEDPSTTADHLPPIESLYRCVSRDTTSPRTMVPEFDRNTTADRGAAGEDGGKETADNATTGTVSNIICYIL